MSPEQVSPLQSWLEVEPLIDELGALDKELAPLRSKITREEKLRKTLRGCLGAADPLAEVHGAGKKFRVVLGPCGIKRVVLSRTKLFRALTAKVFRQVATVTFDQIDAHLSPVEQVGITGTEQSGPRPLRVYEL